MGISSGNSQGFPSVHMPMPQLFVICQTYIYRIFFFKYRKIQEGKIKENVGTIRGNVGCNDPRYCI